MNKTIHKKNAKSGSRFFCPDELGIGAVLNLPADAGNHAIRSLRLGVDDPVVLFDGNGGEYLARITRVERGAVTVKTETFADHEA